jgi:hypothetical protein
MMAENGAFPMSWVSLRKVLLRLCPILIPMGITGGALYGACCPGRGYDVLTWVVNGAVSGLFVGALAFVICWIAIHIVDRIKGFE